MNFVYLLTADKSLSLTLLLRKIVRFHDLLVIWIVEVNGLTELVHESTEDILGEAVALFR